MTYSITKWNERFENSRSRVLKELSFVCIPNHHDGDGYTELMSRPNGTALYGAWCLIVQVASKCSPRGTLVRENGKPHDAASIARKTRACEKVLAEALVVLAEIGWLQSSNTLTATQSPKVLESNTTTADQSHEPALERQRIEWKEGNGTEQKEHTPPLETTPVTASDGSSALFQGSVDPNDHRSRTRTALIPTKNKPSVTGMRSDAEEIYQAYPKKVGKPEALKAIGQCLADGVPKEKLIAAAKAFAASKWYAENFSVWDPVRFFKNGHYDDDPAVWNRSTKRDSSAASSPARHYDQAYADELREKERLFSESTAGYVEPPPDDGGDEGSLLQNSDDNIPY